MSKKRVSGAWVDDTPHIYNTSTDTFSTLPHEVIGDGQPISAYTIKGNMQQSGTPTPSNPVYPTEVGEKTANLFDTSLLANNYNLDYNTGLPYSFDGRIATLNPVTYSGITNAILTYRPTTSGTNIAFIYSVYNDNSFVRRVANNSSGTILDLSDGNKLYVCFFNSTISISTDSITDIMLNTGSTAQTYEPYGYKIPISFGQGTYTSYLAEPIRKIGTAVDSMASTGTVNRVIKKWILTGTENFEWKKSTAYSGGFYTSWHNSFGGIQNGQFYCSHAQYVSDITDYQQNTCYSDGSCNIRIMQSSSTVQDWIDYLSQQYAAGTPVTVWYVLETAQTESFTAPSIPTSGTAQSFDVSTTLKPSEVSLTYHGWHEHEDTKYTT